ncbi:hypothetical protein [Limnoglobus roseus]|uniref:Uncharacterized protein n=1 Tax=Limnoglobus roseus TaxID=2598579 RepID=A0A5C1AHD0_9BACT|nr:hypothetical protein [Limnoglobus roseus]QEL18035.1 hypothetical protein PX52LOC_05049 [Limnoglobus roseus]
MTLSRLPSIGLKFLLVAALGSLPACSLPQFLQRDAVKPALPAAPAPGSDFKVLQPGQRIPKVETVVLAPKASLLPPNEPVNPIVPPDPVPASATVPNHLPDSGLLEPRERGPRPDGPLVLALRAHLDNQYGAAVNHLGSFEKPNQELLLLLLPLLDTARTTDLTGRDPKGVADLARQLDAVGELVAKTAPLEIKTTAFVYKVVQYGVYDPLPAGYRFLPGGIGLLYAEIDRASAPPAVQSNGEAGYVTKLEGSIQLKDATGQIVNLYDIEKGKMVPELPFKRADFTRSPVRDFFLKVEFPVPEKAGKYSLILDIRDSEPDTPRRSRKVVEFQVGG